jgi:hypothetical protein
MNREKRIERLEEEAQANLDLYLIKGDEMALKRYQVFKQHITNLHNYGKDIQG